MRIKGEKNHRPKLWLSQLPVFKHTQVIQGPKKTCKKTGHWASDSTKPFPRPASCVRIDCPCSQRGDRPAKIFIFCSDERPKGPRATCNASVHGHLHLLQETLETLDITDKQIQFLIDSILFSGKPSSISITIIRVKGSSSHLSIQRSNVALNF